MTPHPRAAGVISESARGREIRWGGRRLRRPVDGRQDAHPTGSVFPADLAARAWRHSLSKKAEIALARYAEQFRRQGDFSFFDKE